VEFEGGKVHLAGVSNGGLSAYRVITEYPPAFFRSPFCREFRRMNEPSMRLAL
jgi:hypothetical protein